MSVGFAATSGVNRVTSGSTDLMLIPRGNAWRGFVPVVFAHGATSLGSGSALDQFDNPIKYPNLLALSRAVASVGLACVASDLGGSTTWANDAIASPIADNRAAFGALGGRTDKVLFLTGSMGTMSAMRYAADNPGQVAAVASVIPCCDIDDVRDNNLGGLQAGINTAWGLTAGSTSATVPIPDRGRVIHRGADLTGLPWHGWYSANDPIARAPGVLALAAAIGASTTVTDCDDTASPTHGDSEIGHVPVGDLVAFLLAHAV